MSASTCTGSRVLAIDEVATSVSTFPFATAPSSAPLLIGIGLPSLNARFGTSRTKEEERRRLRQIQHQLVESDRCKQVADRQQKEPSCWQMETASNRLDITATIDVTESCD